MTPSIKTLCSSLGTIFAKRGANYKKTIMEEKEIQNPEQTEEVKVETTVENESTEDTANNAEEGTEETAELTDADKLAQAEAEIADLKDKLLRQVADFTNYRRQQQKNIADLILNGGKKVIESILPILDDMERAQQNIEKSDDIETAREGLNMIFQKMNRVLELQGLKKMETAEKEFDTDFHEAVAILPMGEDKKNQIIDTVQAGYLLNDKVLRHAKVVVGQ